MKGSNVARAVGVIPLCTEINKYFIDHYLSTNKKSDELNRLAHEVARKTLNLEDVKTIKIPIPSLLEQNQIVSEIESRLSGCDQLEKSIQDSLNKTEALRQSILKKAFSGELTKEWREENPELISGENSAEKLLERITAEKITMGSRKAAKNAT